MLLSQCAECLRATLSCGVSSVLSGDGDRVFNWGIRKQSCWHSHYSVGLGVSSYLGAFGHSAVEQILQCWGCDLEKAHGQQAL